MDLTRLSYQLTAPGSIENWPFQAGLVRSSQDVGTGRPFCFTSFGL